MKILFVPWSEAALVVFIRVLRSIERRPLLLLAIFRQRWKDHSHLCLSTFKCHNTEVAITVRAEKRNDRFSIFHLILRLVTTWGRCSPKCPRWWSRSRACCHRGRPCPCRPSAASSGCTTPWAPRCSESSPPSRWATRLEASLATSVPGSCSRPGRVAGVWGFDLRVLLVYLANRLDYWNVVQSFTIGFSSVYIYIIRFSHLYLWWLKIAKNSVGF